MFKPAFPKFTVYYAVIAILHLLSLAFLPTYVAVTKPLIMASLIGFYISAVSKQNHLFLLSLILAMMGDVFLLFEGELFFLMGLGAFFIMQLGYGFTFMKDKKQNKPPVLAITAILIFAAVMTYILWPHVADLRPYIILYMASILFMVAMAFWRGANSIAFTMVATGAVFFMVSDSLLAINKFIQPLPWGHYLIMITYIFAQYSIVTGMALSHRQSN